MNQVRTEAFDPARFLELRMAGQLQERVVQGDQPLLLDDPSAVYLTTAPCSLFCVEAMRGEAEGRRDYLVGCEAGQLLLGLPALDADQRHVGLMLSGVTGTRVLCCSRVALATVARAPEGRRALTALLEGWVRLLVQLLPENHDRRHGLHVQLRSAPFAVECGQALCGSADGIAWVRSSAATVRYMTVPLQGPLAAPGLPWPVTERASLALEQGGATVAGTAELLRGDPRLGFLEPLQAFVRESLRKRRSETSRLRLLQDATSRWVDQHTVREALSHLGDVPGVEPLSKARRPVDTFTRACDRLFRSLGLMDPPTVDRPAGRSFADAQAVLSRLRGVRTRVVMLDDTLLEHDCGALLAFQGERAEELQPVALTRSGKGYRAWDGHGGAEVLDARAARMLYPRAFQFYPGLPQRPLRVRDLLLYGSTGVRRELLAILLISLAAGAVGTLLPLLTGQVFDRIIPGAERNLLLQLTGLLAALYLGSGLFELTRGHLAIRVQTRMDARLEAGIWDRLLSLPVPFFRRYTAGDLADRVAGVGAIHDELSQVALTGILGGLFSVWNLGLLFYFDTSLAFAAVGMVLVAGVVGALATGLGLRHSRRLSELDGRLSGVLLQLLSAVSKLRVAGAEGRAFAVWARLFAERRDAFLAGERIELSFSVFHGSYPVVCSAIIYALIAQQGGAAAMTTGRFLAFSAALSLFMAAFLSLIEALLQTLAILPQVDRARPILSAPLESHGQGGDTTFALQGGIELCHVSFRYAEDGPLVLSDVDLRVQPGEFVAVVGKSGSGKSTLLRILLGFEALSEGEVLYDGKSIHALDARVLRQQIGVVLQHSQIMAGSILSNIVGSSGLSIEDAYRAAAQAAFDAEIDAMPMGMHTVLSQGGGSLSGGQRQRLLIARALVTQPRVVFFDEATSALDNRTQAEVSESLDQLQVTRVVIAHRLSTVRHADTIVVMDGGRIVQRGTYEQLVRERGLFAELARRQLM